MLYEAETCGIRRAERKNINSLETKCLRCFIRVAQMDSYSNEEERRRKGIYRELVSRVDQRAYE